MIKKIRVKNFKSFKDLELNIGKVNILIGANGSGKSNFVQIFRFLRDIVKDGLEKAISIQGETKYLRNVNIDISENLLIEIMLATEEIPYSVFIEFTEDGYGYCKIVNNNHIVEYKPNINGPGKTIYFNIEETLALNEKINIEKSDGSKIALSEKQTSAQSEMGNSIDFKSICICNFDPKLSKMAVPIFVKADLEEDGSNLVIFIKKILDDPEKKRMFLNLVSYLLPDIEDIKVDKFTETHYYLRIKEKYSDKDYLPAPLISDGTINALGLIVALYFQESPLIIIEEPDRGFHPSLISRVIGMMKDAAEYGNKQIIVTTHSPEMVRHADPKNVLLVSRNEKGFSSIKKPYRKKDVKIFLENGMRLSDLYVDELLEI
jgi:predicted ATPase